MPFSFVNMLKKFGVMHHFLFHANGVVTVPVDEKTGVTGIKAGSDCASSSTCYDEQERTL